MNENNLKTDIAELSKKIGIEAIGFAKARRFDELETIVKSTPEIEFAQSDLETRLDPQKHLKGARTIIAAAFPYKLTSYEIPDGHVRSSSSMYPDYHIVVQEKLGMLKKLLEDKYGAKCAVICDTQGLIDRHAAFLSGLGFYGKNTFLISEKFGSAFNIGYLLTDLEIEPEIPSEKTCGECDLCQKACPSSAISNFGNDMSRCISYLTQKSDLSLEEEENIKDYIYGCDICQKVCPYNKVFNEVDHTCINIDKILTISNKKFRNEYKGYDFTWRGGRIIKRNTKIILKQTKE